LPVGILWADQGRLSFSPYKRESASPVFLLAVARIPAKAEAAGLPQQSPKSFLLPFGTKGVWCCKFAAALCAMATFRLNGGPEIDVTSDGLEKVTLIPLSGAGTFNLTVKRPTSPESVG
jgi:hypothetical protein